MLAVRIEEDLNRQLTVLARHKRRSKSDLVREALRRYLDADAWLRECRRQSDLAVQASRSDSVEGLLEDAADEVSGWS